MRQYALVAVDICNDYLEHYIDADEAKTRIKDVSDSSERYINNIVESYGEDTFVNCTDYEYSDDDTVSLDIYFLYTDIQLQSYGSKTYADVEATRDELLADIGE